MKTEDVLGHKARLEDLDTDQLPKTFLFQDPENEETEEVKVTEEKWSEALKTFKHKQQDVDNKIIWKYISKKL